MPVTAVHQADFAIHPGAQRRMYMLCAGVVDPVDPWDGGEKPAFLPNPLPSFHTQAAPSKEPCLWGF